MRGELVIILPVHQRAAQLITIDPVKHIELLAPLSISPAEQAVPQQVLGKQPSTVERTTCVCYYW